MIVHEDVLIRQGQHGLGIGNEEVGQLGRAGIAVGGGQHALVDDVGVAHAVHPHADALLLPDGAVEFLHQHVHG